MGWTMTVQIYIAAPFFTPPELAVVERIERFIGNAGHNFFSPRETGRARTQKERAHCFERNAGGINGSELVLAWVDRKLPADDLSVRICRTMERQMICLNCNAPTAQLGSCPRCDQRAVPDIADAYTIESGPLMQPDLGTVWEIGYAYALQIPVLLFSEHERSQMNLMLTESSGGVVLGWDHLESVLRNSHVDGMLDDVSSWEGPTAETDDPANMESHSTLARLAQEQSTGTDGGSDVRPPGNA